MTSCPLARNHHILIIFTWFLRCPTLDTKIWNGVKEFLSVQITPVCDLKQSLIILQKLLINIAWHLPWIKNSFVSSLLKTSVCGVYLTVQCPKSMNLRIFFLYKSYPSLFALNYTSCFKYILLFPVGASTSFIGS